MPDQITPPTLPPPPAEHAHEYGKLYYEQNKILWGRIQTAYLMEAATLTAFYKLVQDGKGDAAFWLLILSLALLILLFAVMTRDVELLTMMRKSNWLPLPEIPTSPYSLKCKGRTIALIVPGLLIFVNAFLALLLHARFSLSAEIPSWLAK